MGTGQNKTEEANKKIAFILNAFPVLSQTFIANEILGLREMGLDIALFSLFKPRNEEANKELRDLEKEIYFLIPSIRPLSLLATHLFFILRFPGRYWKALVFSLRHRQRDRSVLNALWRIGVTRKELSKEQRQDLLLHFLLVAPLARKMMQQNIRHINSHFADAAASFAMLASRLLLIPYSITAHAYDIFTSQTNFKEKFREARFIITCTHYNRAFIRENYPYLNYSKVKVVYHGIDPNRFKRTKKRSSKEPALILSVGRLVPKKGLVVLIQACKLLKEEGIPFKCRIIGEGPERPRLEMKIKLDNLIDDVELIGSVMPGEMKAHYQEAALFALPCIVEENGNRDGIPNVIAEAMAMELPIVSTTVSAIPELVENGESGILVEQGDVGATAEAIKTLIRHPRLATMMGKKGRKRVEEIFDARKNLQQLKEIYDFYLFDRREF